MQSSANQMRDVPSKYLFANKSQRNYSRNEDYSLSRSCSPMLIKKSITSSESQREPRIYSTEIKNYPKSEFKSPQEIELRRKELYEYYGISDSQHNSRNFNITDYSIINKNEFSSKYKMKESNLSRSNHTNHNDYQEERIKELEKKYNDLMNLYNNSFTSNQRYVSNRNQDYNQNKMSKTSSLNYSLSNSNYETKKIENSSDLQNKNFNPIDQYLQNLNITSKKREEIKLLEQNELLIVNLEKEIRNILLELAEVREITKTEEYNFIEKLQNIQNQLFDRKEERQKNILIIIQKTFHILSNKPKKIDNQAFTNEKISDNNLVIQTYQIPIQNDDKYNDIDAFPVKNKPKVIHSKPQITIPSRSNSNKKSKKIVSKSKKKFVKSNCNCHEKKKKKKKSKVEGFFVYEGPPNKKNNSKSPLILKLKEKNIHHSSHKNCTCKSCNSKAYSVSIYKQPAGNKCHRSISPKPVYKKANKFIMFPSEKATRHRSVGNKVVKGTSKRKRELSIEYSKANGNYNHELDLKFPVGNNEVMKQQEKAEDYSGIFLNPTGTLVESFSPFIIEKGNRNDKDGEIEYI